MDAGPWTTALVCHGFHARGGLSLCSGAGNPDGCQCRQRSGGTAGSSNKGGARRFKPQESWMFWSSTKTGTLTVGRPTVTASDLSARDRRNAAALEAYSVHPLAHAIVRWRENLRRNGSSILPRWSKCGKSPVRESQAWWTVFPTLLDAPETRLIPRGRERRWKCSETAQLAGRIILNDAVKEEAAGAVTALIKRGIKPIMGHR